MKRILLGVIFSVALVGCATPKSNVTMEYVPTGQDKLSVIIKSDQGVSVPADQLALLEAQIRNGLEKAGLLAVPEESSQHIVTLQIHSFRMRDDSARLTVGVMAGCDNIEGTVTVKNRINSEDLGSSDISIKECAAWGVAGQVIAKYADGVLAYLSK
jgi:hypothetical protein